MLRNGDCIQGALSLSIVPHRLANNEVASEPNFWIINQINFGTFAPPAGAILGVQVYVTQLLGMLGRCLASSGDICTVLRQPCKLMNVFGMYGDFFVEPQGPVLYLTEEEPGALQGRSCSSENRKSP